MQIEVGVRFIGPVHSVRNRLANSVCVCRCGVFLFIIPVDRGQRDGPMIKRKKRVGIGHVCACALSAIATAHIRIYIFECIIANQAVHVMLPFFFLLIIKVEIWNIC